MTLPEISIKRHVLAWMINAVLVLFGVISYGRIGMDRFPYIEFPVVSVTTTLKGANPDIVDASITNIIESAVNSTPGIEHIQSTSSPGVSVIGITFGLEKKIDVAFNEVQAKVNQVLRRLPDDVDPPVVAKVETNAQPIMWLALQGDRTQQQLNQYAVNVLKKRLETIDGVGEIRLGGRRDRTIRVELRPDRMAALGVTAQDITDAFDKEHVQMAGGFVVGQKTESLVKLDLEFHSVEALGTLVVAWKGGAPIRLGDVADLVDGLSDYRQLARFNGEPTIGLGIVKITNTNTVAIIERVKDKLDQELRPLLPPGLQLHIVSNDAVFILEIINSLKEHLLEGTILAALVVWIFLLSVRSTLIVALAIPVSLMGAVAVIYFAGYTLNSLTLLGLLLLIGVVVDDAIVVLENIFRHREELDADPVSAAINGANEVFFAVLAATLSLVSIFAPVIFLSGIIGQFFRSFAVVVTFGVMVSLFVSLTLTPMLCSRFLTVREKGHARSGFQAWIARGFERLEAFYRRALAWALSHRWKVVALTALAVASSAFFFTSVGKTFAPDQDEGRFLVYLRTPLGSSIDYTDSRLREVEAVLRSHPEIFTEFALIGLGTAGQVNQGLVVARMVAREQRNITQQELLPRLRRELAEVPGARAFAAPYPMVQGQRGEPLQFVLAGENLTEVGRLSRELQQKLAADPGLGRIDTDLQLDLPQLAFQPDRLRIASAGLTTRDVALAINMLTGGVDIAKYNDEPGDGQRYDIRVKARSGEFTQPGDLSKIWLRNRDGKMIRLDSVATFQENLGPAVIGRFDLQYATTFFATPTIPLGEAVARVREAAADLPTGYQVKLIGQAEEFSKTVKYMTFAFGLALILLYMVLASQFNSFLQPLIVMLAQPLAIIGGIAALWATGQTLNIYSMIGLVLLIGLVAKNSILLVDLTNQRRATGLAIDAALTDACPIRMRPVLMTSATVILALTPAALGLGAGSETNQPLALAVIGGMVSSTLLTLVVVPAVYSLVESAVARRRTHHAAV
ncbi:MAG TPA: efflux RND transporter permease subunit [Rhodocyclaceae bacterium]|jgi:HAE1 family hydrophobic/amphiphilic exporter-1|nr:efflux RND transporter permease subunit [Rhodocyclaceae bacterium]HNM21485.1 efflux RND transporter permease subunit [Rhodocyclaceae bacterium]HNM81773.1 efflux RND transporter permease subunit [Rhodocyclaceae bacterium]HNP03940.1 efflux RND transporter permease subunit [Rhodocyclaceae bacterium]